MACKRQSMQFTSTFWRICICCQAVVLTSCKPSAKLITLVQALTSDAPPDVSRQSTAQHNPPPVQVAMLTAVKRLYHVTNTFCARGGCIGSPQTLLCSSQFCVIGSGLYGIFTPLHLASSLSSLALFKSKTFRVKAIKTDFAQHLVFI